MLTLQDAVIPVMFGSSINLHVASSSEAFGQMRRLSLCFIACLSRGVNGLDCSGIRDCGACAVAREGFDQCGWCGTSSKGSCAKGGAFGPKVGKCDRQCWFSGSIDANKCPGSCEGSTCGECVASKNCMWCASTQTCGAKVGAFGDMCVGQKAVSCKSSDCAKTRDDSKYCPKVSCSSLTKCNACAQEPGCAWDAKNLKCVERASSAFNKACQSSDTDEHCLLVTIIGIYTGSFKGIGFKVQVTLILIYSK